MLIPFGILSAASVGPTRVGVAGYAAGGILSSGSSAVDKFEFPSDTRTTLGTGLSSARDSLTGFANSGVAGYAAGGDASGNVDTVDKFAFPADTRSTLATGLSAARRYLAGFADEGIL